MKGTQAWITSAVDDKSAKTALVLAASLRAVRTSKHLVVIVGSNINQGLLRNLKEVYDLTIPLDCKPAANGFSPEDCAKIQGLSLMIFNKCVYLAPTTLVLKNCDNVFEMGEESKSIPRTQEHFHVYIFTPSTNVTGDFEEDIVYSKFGEGGTRPFSMFMAECKRNQLLKWEFLRPEYSVRVSLKETPEKGEHPEENVSVVNFVDVYPLELYENDVIINYLNLGSIEEHAVQVCCQLWYSNFGSADKELIDADRQFSSKIPRKGYGSEPIAIVGLSFRLPGGNTVDAFWDLLVKGKEAIKPVPPFRWTKDHLYLPCKTREVQAGFLNTPIDEFDAKFFGLSPKDAEFLDPQQRLLLEVTWHALEDAGIDPHSLQETLSGFFVGSWMLDYKDLAVRSTDADFFRTYLGNSIAATAARLSHFLGTTGPSIATESGCSSSMVAVDMACKSLRNRDSNLALACGVNLLIHSFSPEDFQVITAPDGRCKTFDAKADGFGRAEGCAVLVLKRLSDAIRDENNIWGLIRGSAVSQEGISKSLGTPTIHSEALAMELALRDADIEPKDVSYIETHGTGTPVGDPMEVAAIEKVYSATRDAPLLIGSVKTNVGHTESVSGITGIIKVLLSLKHETIPPHRNMEVLNPDINLDAIPAEIPLRPFPWLRNSNKTRIAGINSFGISGTDCHVVIEEAPLISDTRIDFKLTRPLHIMKISAKSQESMNQLIDTYATIFREQAEMCGDEFSDVAYSSNTGRSTFSHRAVIVAKDARHAVNILETKSFKQAIVTRKNASICFLFTGQGSQYPGMASTLYSTSPVFRMHFDHCSEILEKSYGIPITKILWGTEANPEEINGTLYSQVSIFCVEYSLLKLWESWGVTPDFVLGHSSGEFAAAVAAGALTIEGALMLVAERSRLIENLPKGKMLVIRADKKRVEREIEKYQKMSPDFWADFAALNTSDQTVIAGNSDNIDGFARHCAENSLKSTVLASSHAVHSRHMDPMLDAYFEIASNIKLCKKTSKSPIYISGMEGKVIDTSNMNAKYWVRHTREKVNFVEACKAAQSNGCTIFLEIGPHPIAAALAMQNMEGSPILCLPSLRRNQAEWETILESLSNLFLSEWKGEINWKGFDLFYNRKRVEVPFYPFNRTSVWVKTERLRDQLHPLLGTTFPNPTNQFIFENRISAKNTNFLQHHAIGGRLIFPGSAFLELILAGGYASVQGLTEEWTLPRRAIAAKDVRILAPLAISDSETCYIQTVVTMEQAGEDSEPNYSVSVHRNANQASNSNNCQQWVLHATGSYRAVVQKMPGDFPSEIDISSIQSSWEEHDYKEFYEKLPEVGLHFGLKFQSLQVGWKGETGHLAKVRIPEERASYLIHPILVDAMFQAIALWMSQGKLTKLQVPVRIGEFIWFSSSNIVPTANDLYIYCSTHESGTAYSLLLDCNGKALAYLSDVEFAITSVKLIEGMIQQQSSIMPGLWQEVWKPKPGPSQNRVELHNFEFPTKLSADIETKLDAFNSLPAEENLLRKNLSDLTDNLFQLALYKLGWNPKACTPFFVEDLLESLSILDVHKKFVQFFLRRLVNNHTLNLGRDDIFSFRGRPPTFDEISEHTQNLMQSIDRTRVMCKLVIEVGNILHEVLLGIASPWSILFPQDTSRATAGDVYLSGGKDLREAFLLTIDSFVFDSIRHIIEKQTKETLEAPFLRILEVGAGTAMLTQLFVGDLIKKGFKFEYHYTDISAAFFSEAEKILGEDVKHVVFKKFDMEEDPLEQGFCPEYFDVILAVETIHIAKDVCKTLKNLRTLLKPRGLLLVVETITENPFNTFTFGLLEGYWSFEDLTLRQSHPTLTPEKWTDVIQSSGFVRVVWKPAVESTHGIFIGWAPENGQSLRELRKSKHSWLIFDIGTQITDRLLMKLTHVNRNVVIIPKPSVYTEENEVKSEIKRAFNQVSEETEKFEGIIYLWGLTEKEDRDQARVSLPFLTLLQLLPTCGKLLPRLFLVTQGICNVNESQVENPTAATLRGMMATAMNENTLLDITHLDLSPAVNPLCQVDELFSNLWLKETGTVVFRLGKRLVPKLTAGKIENDNRLTLPNGCHRFKLQLPESRLISDLEFVSLGQLDLDDDEVEVQVKAVALNFRDVFTVLKPTEEFEALNSIGMDLSGKITRIGSKVTSRKVGDRIIGMNKHKNLALPSHATMCELDTIALPFEMTYAEGSTIPIVFSTATFCLVNVAKMKRGEAVLIHTASGGVGLAAIQIANHIGANVIATAGSERKRNYLRNLGIQHIFHSRTTDFGNEILRVTKGRGVDIVLNSLTGPGFKEASLDALALNGRFIEMSKLNLWTTEEVKERRPDVYYEIVDIGNIADPAVYSDIATKVESLVRDNIITPIPYERFDAVNIRGGLTYLQKGKHIGKIVCIMPEVKMDKSKVIETTPLFNKSSTYLVTGGQGGVGFEVVKWILRNGGKHVAIASRKPPNAEVSNEMSTWNKSGHHVEAFSVDIGNFEECSQLLNRIASSNSSFPPLRGVMHAAGVLEDSILENQSWLTFRNTYIPKVNGTWNLHDLTKNKQLEHFVLFSSMAAVLGTSAQANHSASNSFQDAFAHFRKSVGLPALSISWGIWGEVGVATEVDLPGVRPISTLQGLHVLGTCLRTPTTHVGVANVESFALLATLLPRIRSYIDDQNLLGVVTSTTIINADEFWTKVDAASNYEETLVVFKEVIKVVARSVLKYHPDDDIDDDSEFHTLGIDSLMMLEMRNGLQNIFGQRMTLTIAQLKDCNTTDALATRLIDILHGEDYLRNMPSMEELKQLIREDSMLPEHVAPTAEMKCRNTDQVEVVLLTGVTGNLGPYLLRELSQRTNVKKVFCLIRKRGKHSATNRLESKLRNLEILSEIDMSKVECLEGDISSARFGMSDEKYEELAVNVDAIVHSAALLILPGNYWRAPGNYMHSVRTANVLGTIKVLEFAVHRTLKHIFYMSTLTAVVSVDANGHLSEDWQDVGAFDELPNNVGYSLSKHICEQLIRQAIERGIPCKALRLPYIGGDCRTGRCHFETSHLILRVLLHMKLGCMPDVHTPIPIIAVDKCAEICIQLLFDPRSNSDVIHICERNPSLDYVIVQIAHDHGVQIDTVPYPDFLNKLKTLDDSSALWQITEVYNDKLVTENVSSPVVTCFKKYLENSRDFFTNDKIRKLYPDFEDTLEPTEVVLRRDMEFLKQSGVYKTVGINN